MVNNDLKQPVIYKITNIETGVMYIGKTTANLYKRWMEHMTSANNINSETFNSKFSNAIRKSDIIDWTLQIIEVVRYPSSINTRYDKNVYILNREKFWIEKFDAIENGYNTNLPIVPQKPNFTFHKYYSRIAPPGIDKWICSNFAKNERISWHRINKDGLDIDYNGYGHGFKPRDLFLMYLCFYVEYGDVSNYVEYEEKYAKYLSEIRNNTRLWHVYNSWFNESSGNK